MRNGFTDVFPDCRMTTLHLTTRCTVPPDDYEQVSGRGVELGSVGTAEKPVPEADNEGVDAAHQQEDGGDDANLLRCETQGRANGADAKTDEDEQDGQHAHHEPEERLW
jgi:hypothetical protein